MSKHSNLKGHKSYYKHFIFERFLSVITFALTFALLFGIAKIETLSYLNLIIWLKSPLNMALLIVAIAFAILYSLSVIKVILIDYVPNSFIRLLTVYIANTLAFIIFVFFIISVLFLGV